MIQSLKSLLEEAELNQRAVLAPDFTNLGVARAMIDQAEASQTPLILSFSMGFKPIIEIRPFTRFIQVLRDEMAQSSVSMCLHLDHGESLEDIREAVEAGFTSVMIDASSQSFEENIRITQEAVAIAKPHGVDVESELGTLTSGTGYFKQDNARKYFTDPEKAAEFAQTTQIDCLAVSIGNAHGRYQGKPHIDFERLAEINENVEIPLVLHGTSGIGGENLRKAVRLGIRKINLYSDILIQMHENLLAALQENISNPVAAVQAQHQGVRSVLQTYLELLETK